jgi:ABC-type Zn uptake system ZnuABC Zn-binding protein ZnuA
MKKIRILLLPICVLISFSLAGCQKTLQVSESSQSQSLDGAELKVLAVESFLADITQNVAGDRLQVETLMPAGIDPHAFEPTPQDVARIAESQVLVANGAGLEMWLERTMQNAGGERVWIEASTGLTSRLARAGEEVETASEEDHTDENDPHFWLDPLNVVKYVENIRDGLITADPAGEDTYTRNAAEYISQLNNLDAWIRQQVANIPAERCLMVTNHESFGYFADRYGFKIIGTIIPSVSTGAAPSAQQMARLVDQIRETGAIAIFLETGSNPNIAEQIAQETGVKVVSELYTHSINDESGNVQSYIDMMEYNVETIVEALRNINLSAQPLAQIGGLR